MNAYATYAHTFANDYNFKIMLGGTAEESDYNYLYNKRDIMLNVDQPYLGLTTGGANKTGYTITNTMSQYATAGFFGRINFDYKGIYLLELNGRYDGSSRFPLLIHGHSSPRALSATASLKKNTSNRSRNGGATVKSALLTVL